MVSIKNSIARCIAGLLIFSPGAYAMKDNTTKILNRLSPCEKILLAQKLCSHHDSFVLFKSPHMRNLKDVRQNIVLLSQLAQASTYFKSLQDFEENYMYLLFIKWLSSNEKIYNLATNSYTANYKIRPKKALHIYPIETDVPQETAELIISYLLCFGTPQQKIKEQEIKKHAQTEQVLALYEMADKLHITSLLPQIEKNLLRNKYVCKLLHDNDKKSIFDTLNFEQKLDKLFLGKAVLDIYKTNPSYFDFDQPKIFSDNNYFITVRSLCDNYGVAIASCYRKSCLIFNITNSEIICEIPARANASIENLTWSPSGTYLALTIADNNWAFFDVARPWDFIDFKLAAKINNIVWSSCGTYLALDLADNSWGLFNVTNPWNMEIFKCEAKINNIGWSPCGALLAVTYDNICEICDVANRKVSTSEYDTKISCTQWSPCGTYLALTLKNGTCQIFNIANQQIIATLKDPNLFSYAKWSSCGTYLTTAPCEGICQIFNVATPQILTTFKYPGLGSYVAWSPCNPYLATYSKDDETCQIFDVANQQIIAVIEHETSFLHMKWSPCGTYLITQSGDHTCKIFNVTNQQIIATLKYKAWIWNVEWSPCGTHLALSDHITCEIFNVAKQQTIATIHHAYRYPSITWSSRGTYLAIWSDHYCFKFFCIKPKKDLLQQLEKETLELSKK